MNFVKANIFNFSAACAIMLLNLLVSIIESRILGPTNIGYFQLFISTQSICMTVCAFGMGSAGLFFARVHKVPIKTITTTSIRFILTIGAVLACMLFFIFFFNAGYFGKVGVLNLIIFSIGSMALLFTTSLQPLLLFDMQVVRSKIVPLACAVFQVVVIVSIVVAYRSLSLNNVLLITGLSQILSAVILLYYFRADIDFSIAKDLRLLKSMLSYGLKMSGNTIAVLFLLNAPVYSLRFFAVNGAADVGYYSRAMSICSITAVINSSIGPLLFAKWTGMDDEHLHNQIEIASSIFLVVNFLLSIFIIVFAKYIILLLYGTQFMQSVVLLRILSLALIFNGVKEILFNVTSSKGNPELILKNLIITLITFCPILIFCTKKYGMVGCCWSVIFSSVITVYLLMSDVNKKYHITVNSFCIRSFADLINDFAYIIKQLK